jgi:LPS-assembly protein
VAAVSRAKMKKPGAAFLASAAACAYIFISSAALSAEALPSAPATDSDSKLFLSSEMVVYDHDQNKVTASGAVRINYAGYKLVANRVTYDRKSGRLMADGKIEMVEPQGNRIYADNLDITDDFGKGFANSLRVETTDDTHMAAESGERVNADVFILRNGVYTACKSCAEHPERAPLWQVKAEKVIENGKTHTVRLEKTRFELFGMPIAYLPVIEVPDHTVQRQSGFLFPTWSSSQNLGFGATVPYYLLINPSMDATFSPTYYTNQGFMLDAEFRQKFENGQHTLRVFGINQQSPSSFTAGTSDAVKTQRYGMTSKAEFDINSRWKFGWDVLFQSDNNFSRTYSITDTTTSAHTNQIYLTGLGDRNYFDARSYYFDVQDADTTNTAEFKQAFVHPVIDYNYVAPEAIAGGELTVDANFTSLTHRFFDAYSMAGYNRFNGLRGESSRFTAEAEWKKQYISSMGLVLTPSLAARGDAFQLGLQSPSNSGYAYGGSLYSGASATRSMLTAGLEARYPILISAPGSSHVIEPIAQIYVRPNEQLAGRLPNDDAQSFVFDASNLFTRDKYSGYDRVEGGTRANVGVRYTGTFDNGYKINAVAGQSFQIAGVNSFATSDFVNAGADSGLQKKASDYVGMVGLDLPVGVSVSESLRMDRETFKLARSDTTMSTRSKYVDASLTYTRVGAQPAYGLATNSDEITAGVTLKIKDFWKLYGSATWNFTDQVLSSDTFGISYDDECTIFSLGVYQTRDTASTSANDWAVGARLSFRTLGDIKVGNSTATSF